MDGLMGSCTHMQWFQWLHLATHHGYVTLDGSHMHWNKQKFFKDMIINIKNMCKNNVRPLYYIIDYKFQISIFSRNIRISKE